MEQINFENKKERKKSSDNKRETENQKNKKLIQLIKNNSVKDLNIEKSQKIISPKNIEYSECKKSIYINFSNKKI